MYSLREFEYIIGISRLEIEELIVNRNKYYEYFKQYKKDNFDNIRFKNGRPLFREFNATNGILKIVQKKIKTKILDKLIIEDCILGGVTGESNINNAYKHRNSEHFFQTDISAFFPSINQTRIYNTLKAKEFSNKIAYYISMLVTCTNSKGIEILPQGASTSTSIANLVFERIDKLILSIIPKESIYTRWVDDLTLSSVNNIEEYQSEIIDIISSCGFKAAGAKTTYRIGSAVITGILAINGKIKPTKDTFKKLKELKDENRINGLKNYIQQIRKKNRQLITIDKK
jgi:hypothetical protein